MGDYRTHVNAKHKRWIYATKRKKV